MEEKDTVAKVVTVGIYQQGGADECERSLKELERLVETAGGKVFATLTQLKNTPEAATYIGEGKLNELAEICKITMQIRSFLTVSYHPLRLKTLRM